MQLPTGMEILKNFYYIKSRLAKNVKKSSTLYCIPDCMKESQCKNGKCKCILTMIKTAWNKAGFPIVSDKTLGKHLSNLEKEYYNLKKHEKRGSTSDLKRQNNFIQKMKKVFWIGTPNLRDNNMMCKKR